MSDQNDYDKLRKRVEKRIKARQEFFSHLVTFLMVNAFLWMIWVVTGAGGFPWPIFVTGGWGIGVVANAMEVYAQSGMAEQARERAVQRGIERERRRLYGDEAPEKPKRDQRARLSDDGEILYEEDEAQSDVERARRASRDRD